jgi:hypothetical protein
MTSEKANGKARDLPPSIPTNGDVLSSTPEAFAGILQAGYDSGYSSGHEAGYRQGLQAGRLEGLAAADQNQNGNPPATAAPGSNSIPQPRLFGLPCAKCRRLMYSDETRCPYCKAPRTTKLGEPPSATCRGPEEGSQRGPDGGLQPLRISRESENTCMDSNSEESSEQP